MPPSTVRPLILHWVRKLSLCSFVSTYPNAEAISWKSAHQIAGPQVVRSIQETMIDPLGEVMYPYLGATPTIPTQRSNLTV